jgi:hypothetical protein
MNCELPLAMPDGQKLDSEGLIGRSISLKKLGSAGRDDRWPATFTYVVRKVAVRACEPSVRGSPR